MSAADLFKSIAEVLDELPQSTSALQELVAELRDQAQAMERKLADERLEMERIRAELLRALEATRLQQESVGADVKAEARAEAQRVSAEISELEQEVAEAVRASERTSAQLAERVTEALRAAAQAAARADEVAERSAPSSAIAEAAEAMAQMKREMHEARDDLSRRMGDMNTRMSKVFVSPPPSSIQVKKDGVKVGERRAINFTGSGVTITDDRDGVQVAISGSGGGGDVVTNVAQDRILGRVTAGSGDSEELTAAQVRTLLNVEDGATADQTAAEILAALLTVDGAGSGLDADLLDGQSSAFYAADSAVVKLTGDQTVAGVKTFSGTTTKVADLVSGGQTIDARYHGALFDASTDDTAAIQAAIDALPSTGGTVLLPRGTGVLNGTLSIVKPVNLVGQGAGPSMANASAAPWNPATSLRRVSGTGNMIAVEDTADIPTSGVRIANLGLDGNNLAAIAIACDRMQGSRIENVSVRNCTDAALEFRTDDPTGGAATIDCRDNLVIGFNATGCDTFVRLKGNSDGSSNSSHNTFMRCFGSYGRAGGSTAPGLDLVDCDNNTFFGFFLFRNSGTGLGVDSKALARQNYFFHLEAGAGGFTARSLTDQTQSSGIIIGYDRGNGQPKPVVDSGGRLDWFEAGKNSSGFNSEWVPQVTRKTAEETVNNSTALQADDTFTFSMRANEVWRVEYHLFVDGGQTGDFKMALDVPTGATYRGGSHGLTTGVTGNSGSATAQSSAADATSWGGMGLAGAGTAVYITASAMIVNGANAGSATLQWAQNTLEVADTKVLANSYMIRQRVA